MVETKAPIRSCAGMLSKLELEPGEEFLCKKCGTTLYHTNIVSNNVDNYVVTIHFLPANHPVFKKDPDGQDLSDATFPY